MIDSRGTQDSVRMNNVCVGIWTELGETILVDIPAIVLNL